MGGRASRLVIGEVLRNAVTAVRRQPFRHLIILGLIPVLWNLPPSQARDALFGRSVGAPFPFLLVSQAWQAVAGAGVTLASIKLGEGKRASLADVARAIRFAPAVFVASLATAVPMWLIGGSVDASLGAQLAAMLLLVPFSLLIAIRGIIWAPLIVDKRDSLVGALRGSWAATRGNSGTILLIILLLAVAFGGMASVVIGRPILEKLMSVVGGSVAQVLVAQVYLSLVKRDRPVVPPTFAEVGGEQVRQLEKDLPVKGTGWSRDTRDER